jgi:hypothetical protein
MRGRGMGKTSVKSGRTIKGRKDHDTSTRKGRRSGKR